MHLTKREWAEHVARWRSSGLVARDYCVSQGLKLSSLRYWASKMRRDAGAALNEAVEGKPARFAKVQLRSSKTTRLPSPASSTRDLRVAVADMEVSVPEGFDAETLERVLRPSTLVLCGFARPSYSPLDRDAEAGVPGGPAGCAAPELHHAQRVASRGG